MDTSHMKCEIQLQKFLPINIGQLGLIQVIQITMQGMLHEMPLQLSCGLSDKQIFLFMIWSTSNL